MSEHLSISKALEAGGIISINPKGMSMFPFVKDTDTVIIKRPTETIKKYDCILFFERENVYVLHRVVKLKGDVVITAGDNNLHDDAPINVKGVVGVLDGVYRNGKYINMYYVKAPLSVRLSCFYPFKVIRIYFYRFISRVKGFFKRKTV